MSRSAVQRLLAIPLILLLLILAVVMAVRDTSPPPQGAAPPMPPVVLPPQAVGPPRNVPDSMSGWGNLYRDRLSTNRGEETQAGESYFSGVVLDRDTGTPIADAFVIAWRLTGQLAAPSAPTQNDIIRRALLGGASADADRQGAFRLGPLPAGRYVLEAYHDGGGLVPWNPENAELIHGLEAGGELTEVKLFVYEGHTVRFKLLDSDSQTPLAGVNVITTFNNITENILRVGVVNRHTIGRTSNEDGMVIVSGVFGDVLSAQFTSPNYFLADDQGRRRSHPPIKLDRDSTTMEVTVPLTPVPLIAARILLPNGDPATEANALWQRGSPRSFTPPRSSARANPLAPVNEAGVYKFLPPGANDGFLVVHVPGYPLALSPEIRFDQSIPETFDVRLERPATVMATVTYPDGTPARRALVTVSPSGSSSPGIMTYVHEFPDQTTRWVLKELCDENGVATLTGLSPGQYQVTAETEGYAPSSSETLRVEPGSTASVALSLGSYGVLGGTVRSPDGEPIEGATVRLHSPAGSSRAASEIITDSTGRFSFQRVPDTLEHRVVATHAHYEQTHLNNPELSRLDLDLTLTSRVWRYTHVLNVIDEETGEPVSGASIVGVEEGGRIRPRTEGNSISFEWQSQSVGMPLLIAAPGYAPTLHSIQPLKEDPRGRIEETVRMGRGVTIIGRVLEEDTGAPMAGVPVRVFASTTPPAGSLWGMQGTPSKSTITDDEGRFAVINIVPIREVPANASSMEQWIRVQIEPTAPMLPLNRILTAPSRRVEDLGDLRANLGRTIRVRVIKDGEPQQGRRIAMELANTDPYQFEPAAANVVTAETDAEGVARFDAIPEGRHRVQLDGTPYSQMVPTTNGNAELEFVLGTSRLVVRCLRGEEPQVIRSLTATREPSAGFTIGGLHRHKTHADRLVLNELPAGEWTMHLLSPGGGSRKVTVADGEEVEVVLNLAIGAISGRVLNTEGQAEENALIQAVLVDSTESNPYRTRISVSDRSGQYSLKGMPAGRWRLEVLNVPHQYAMEEAIIGDEPEQAELERNIELKSVKEGVLFDVRCAETGEQIDGARISLKLWQFHGARHTPRRTLEGLWAFEGLGATTYRFSVTHPWRHTQEMEVTITEDVVETHGVRLALAGTIHVSARTRDVDRAMSRCVIRMPGDPEISPAIREFDLPINTTYVREVHLSPGEYEVWLTLESGRQISERFTIVAASMTRVRLEDDE